MKKIVILLIDMLIASPCFGEGYQVNTLSTRQLGMAHTGTALKLGAESMNFNPGSMAFLDKTLDFSAGITAISPKASAELDGMQYRSKSSINTPFYFYGAFSITNNIKGGLAFTTPYGSSINWGENWPGAILNQKISLKTYSFQPSISWRIIPRLGIGAGLMITWGEVDLNKGLVTASSMDYLLQAMGVSYQFNETTPASVNLKGKSSVRLGVNAGIHYDINDWISIGVAFKSKITAKVKSGDASVTYANQLAQQMLESSVGLINKANFAAQMPLPYVLSFGISAKPINKLTLAFDAQLTWWKDYDVLAIEFNDTQLKGLNQYLPKKYSNSWAFRLGTQISLTPRFDLRCGIYYDNTPVNKKYYNPETPGMDKISPCCGFSFRPLASLSIDFALSYIAGLKEKNASYTYENLIYKYIPSLGQPTETTFTADYSAHALCASIGISYKF